VVWNPVGTSGAIARDAAIDAGLNEITRTGPRKAVRVTSVWAASTATSRRESYPCSPGMFLISSATAARPLARSSTSASVGTAVDASAVPAFRRARSAAVRSCTAPEPSVVRSTVGSCITTGTPSADTRTSSSTIRAPSPIAASKEGRVFSVCRRSAAMGDDQRERVPWEPVVQRRHDQPQAWLEGQR
jgi:hypothetical protein